MDSTQNEELIVNGSTNPEKASNKSNLMTLSAYITALRPWSLSASLMPTLLGSTLAHKYLGNSEFNYLVLLLTIFVVVPVHGAGNLVNTYYDFKKGIDNRKSDDRTLVDHILTNNEVTSLGTFLYTVACFCFMLLAAISPAQLIYLSSVFFCGLSSSFLYSGAIGLKYIALGDVVTLIIFGPISVLFAFMSQTGRLEWATIYYAIPLALNTEAILHSNNTRDRETDKEAGIVTLAILIGHTASHVLYAILLFIPYVMFSVFALNYSKWFILPLPTLFRAFELEKEFRLHNMHSVPKETAKLNLKLGILYVLACSFCTELPFITKR